MRNDEEFQEFMKDIKEEFTEGFNLIVEGISARQNQLVVPTFKLADMNLSESTDVLEDDLYAFTLKGRTSDFESIDYFPGGLFEEEPNVEYIESVTEYESPLLNKSGNQRGTMVYPRAIFRYDGAIYLNDNVESEKDYLRHFFEKVSEGDKESTTVLEYVGAMFDEEYLIEKYINYRKNM